MNVERHLGLKAGELVRVRTAGEILATLDENGTFEGVTFMPEMIPFVGRRQHVYRRVVKLCWYTPESCSRQIEDCVFLDDLRCDGAGHDGCQQECRIFWKDAWLARLDPGEELPESDPADLERLAALARTTVLQKDPAEDGSRLYRCQFIDVLSASRPLPEKAVGQYVEEVTSGNQPLFHLLRVMARAFRIHVSIKLSRYKPLPMALGGADRIDGEKLDLQVGEWVEVRSAEEIGRTLDEHGKHRGLHFSTEMLRACGKRYRVRGRVTRLIDEHSGRMLELKNDCVLLEDMYCPGEYSIGVWFCPRDFYHYWREAWLKRCDPPPGAVTSPPSRAASAA
ncbi:MAG: hypothetical protein ACKVUT_12560 [Gaiella sp.]